MLRGQLGRSLVGTLGILCVVAVGPRVAAAANALPAVSGWAVWEAETAQRVGSWDATAPGASAGQYLQPSAGNGEWALAFPFETAEPMNLRVRPVWWRTGEQKAARRFPYPLMRQPGPEALDAIGTTVFATAPAAGRIVVVDALREEVAGVIEIGGYLTDLIADRDHGKLYAADALGDRVVMIDATTRQIASTWPVTGAPWSLAMDGGVLYVACRDGQRVVALRASTGKVVGESKLPASPISVEVAGGETKQLVVRFQQLVYDALTLEPVAPDQEQFPGDEANGKPAPGCGGPDCRCTWVEAAGPHQIAVVTQRGRKLVDVGAVTRGPASIAGLPQEPGPRAPVVLDVGNPAAQRCFFLSPSRGVLGVMDPKTGALEAPIVIGGYLTGLAVDRSAGKLYVVDAAGQRVVVIDAAGRKVEGEIKVAGGPWGIAFVKEVTQQRATDWQPVREDVPMIPATPVNRLYVTCRDTQELAVVDVAQGTVAQRVLLGDEPREVKFVPMPDPQGWPALADEQIPFALRPRVAVELAPFALDRLSLAPAEQSLGLAEGALRRGEVQVPCGTTSKSFAADDRLVVRVDGQRAVDLSRVADPQWLDDRPLTAKDTAGTITISVDGGPEYDWTRSVWTAPDSGLLQVADSEEYWRYNAPSFHVGPGRHELRVKARSRFARLDAVAVRRSLEPEVTAALVPEPREVHGQVALPSYEGVFYDQQPARFTLELQNHGAAAADLSVSWALRNYLGEVVAQGPPVPVRVDAGGRTGRPIELSPAEWGRFTLTVTCESAASLTAEARFLRLPKLAHPRLFWRKDEAQQIEARIARYPNLFRRYADWLERMAPREGRYPERFLPAGLTREENMAAAPEGMPEWQRREGCGWRNYELGWRMLALEFAADFLRPESATLAKGLTALRQSEKTDRYNQFHHHGPFFPGAEASLVDTAPEGVRDLLPLWRQFREAAGDMNMPAWTLVTVEEPLTPEKRALLYQIMTWENNAERYFETHRGRRGGTWWMNPYTGCHCPMHAYLLSFVFLRNVFGEPRLFEKPIFRGYLTFSHYADPIADKQQLQPERRGPLGEPWRWLMSAMSRHPAEKDAYAWEEWVKQMEGPLAGDEGAAVDRLMALEGRPLTGKLWGRANYFVSGVAVPVALALGWYDPEAPAVKWSETPPTTVFEVEGWVPMRSGWDERATEVTFMSGVREHTTRHKPNHFTIAKGGEYLIGTPSLWWDDGENVSAWGNSVVVGDEWVEQWRMNLQHPRDGEHEVMNRISPSAWSYLFRDEALTPYRPSEGGFGAGLNLHGHTTTLFMNEGRLLAYQTWPELDYVAGDASNAWRSAEVSQLDRQLVFIKPDLVVVYDRVKLGRGGFASRWMAATGPELTVGGSGFRVESGTERLVGRVLLPAQAVLAMPEPPEGAWYWRGQRLLEVAPAQQDRVMEYLVVMRVGEGDLLLPDPELILTAREAGLKLALEGRRIEIRFRRDGPVGGSAMISGPAARARYELRQGVVDSYAAWQRDSRYERWAADPAFSFVVPAGAAPGGPLPR